MGNNRGIKIPAFDKFLRVVSTRKYEHSFQVESGSLKGLGTKCTRVSLSEMNCLLYARIHRLKKLLRLERFIRADQLYVSIPKDISKSQLFLGEEVLQPDILIPVLDDLMSEAEYLNSLKKEEQATDHEGVAVKALFLMRLSDSLNEIQRIVSLISGEIIPWDYYRISPYGVKTQHQVEMGIRQNLSRILQHKSTLIKNSAPRALFLETEKKLTMYLTMLEIMEG